MPNTLNAKHLASVDIQRFYINKLVLTIPENTSITCFSISRKEQNNFLKS